MLKNQIKQFNHLINRAGILYISGSLLLIISGCMIPEYQNPSGFSESYQRNLNALSLPEPAYKLSQKTLYDGYNLGQLSPDDIEVLNQAKKKKKHELALNKGLKSSIAKKNQTDKSGTTSNLKIVSHQKIVDDDVVESYNNEINSGLEIDDEIEEPVVKTRWQKLFRIFSR